MGCHCEMHVIGSWEPPHSILWRIRDGALSRKEVAIEPWRVSLIVASLKGGIGHEKSIEGDDHSSGDRGTAGRWGGCACGKTGRYSPISAGYDERGRWAEGACLGRADLPVPRRQGR